MNPYISKIHQNKSLYSFSVLICVIEVQVLAQVCAEYLNNTVDSFNRISTFKNEYLYRQNTLLLLHYS